MSNEAIILSIQNGQDSEGCLMLELYNNNLNLVKALCNRLNIPEDTKEDIRQEFFLWLSGAVNTFDSQRDNKFSTYLYVYVKGQIISYLESQNTCKIPRYKQMELNNLKREQNRLSQILLREPTNKELASFMGIKISKLIELKKESLGTLSKSLNEIVTEEGNELQELIPEKENVIDSLCNSLDVEYRNKELWRVVTNESGIDKENIVDYYNGTYKGDKRLIRNNLYRTIKNLRKQPGKLKKLEELSDLNYCRSKGVKAFQSDNSSIVEDIAILMYESEVIKMNKAEFKTKVLNRNKVEYSVKTGKGTVLNEGQKENIGTCAICGKPAEKRMLSSKASFEYLTKGIKPKSRSFENVCEACMLRERRTNKIAFELNEEGELIEYR